MPVETGVIFDTINTGNNWIYQTIEFTNVLLMCEMLYTIQLNLPVRQGEYSRVDPRIAQEIN